MPDALTSPGRQNVRPGLKRAEAAVVTCGGPVTQSRGARTRRAEPAGGGRPQGPGAAAGQHLPSRLRVRECGARSRRSAASLLPPPPAPAPQRDTQYSPEAEAAPRGSCQWKLGCRRATAGGPSGACRARRRGGGGEDQLEESGAGGWNAVVQVTRGIRWRKRAAHARGGALKPCPQGAYGRRGKRYCPAQGPRPDSGLARLGPGGAGSCRGRSRGGLRTLSYTSPLSWPVSGEGGSPTRRPIMWRSC